MNYATLEEAWGKEPPRITQEQRIQAAHDKHPILRVPGVPSLPSLKGMSVVQEDCQERERRAEETHTDEQVASYLDNLFMKRGVDAVKALLPKGFLMAIQPSPRFSRKLESIESLPLEEVAKWIFIALIFVLLLDIIRS